MDANMIEVTSEIVKIETEGLYSKHLDILKSLDEREQTELEFLRNIIAQISTETTGPLLLKTPKPNKRPLQRIKTIPENDVMNDSDRVVEKVDKVEKVEESEEEAKPTRSRRAASQRATESIKKQQSILLNTKMRRASNEKDVIIENIKNQTVRISRSKRPKASLSGSEDDDRPPSKVLKISKQELKKGRTKKIKEEIPSLEASLEKIASPLPRVTRRSAAAAAVENLGNPTPPTLENARNKTQVIIDETMELPVNETITEPSMYEDAIGKSIPMNSTMNPNSTMTIERKMMNATVVLDKINVNETIVLKKCSITSQPDGKSNPWSQPSSQKTSLTQMPIVSPLPSSVVQSKLTLQMKLAALKEAHASQDFTGLLTDDDSSPERKGPVKRSKRVPEKFKKPRNPSTSDSDVPRTPPKATSSKQSKNPVLRDIKYKSNTLFSPYAKESVKKKVEAFEQAVQGSPTVDAPTRVTRTKTRAMAAAEETPKVQTLAQKLARKSLAKAKKISLSRQKREDDGKENLASATKVKYFPLANEKLAVKQSQRTTPISKSRLQMPMSVNRIHHTPASNIPPPKSATASKTHATAENIPSKPLSKSGSTDSLADKKRLEEDARRKKEEQLKAVSEEKKRKREEKELKNKRAREAKERQEQMRRQQLEKEREDKARQALLAQEKMREEAEKKKLAQLQRAQEKEERRRQEEMMRLQKIQEQEEAERMLAEQKRREQEAEKKKMQEAKAQQQAALENLKLKATILAKAKQRAEQKQGPQAYVLDSDPDDEESDDEARPKHPIPHWARSEIRRSQLNMQQYIPMESVLKFFGAKKCTPDLSELFVGIKTEKMKRTSSANWKTPPRFSMMENLGD